MVWSRLWNLPVGNYILTVTNTATGTTTNHTTNETSFTIQISPKYMCDILSFSVTAVTDIGLIKSEVTQFFYSDCKYRIVIWKCTDVLFYYRYYQ